MTLEKLAELLQDVTGVAAGIAGDIAMALESSEDNRQTDINSGHRRLLRLRRLLDDVPGL